MLTITPDAGSTKNNLPRKVALHPHLIEQGFPVYVASRKGKPLFYDPARGRSGSDGNPQYKTAGERLAAWVRKLGIKDTDIDPNHAWRHRFKSICRDVGIPLDIRYAIQGHTPRTEGEAYGDTWPEVSFREFRNFHGTTFEGFYCLRGCPSRLCGTPQTFAETPGNDQ